MTTDRILNEDDAYKFLRSLSLKVGKEVVREVLESLTGKSSTSIYELYSSRRRRNGTYRTPICGKGTADKIKHLFEIGALQPYLQYLDEVLRPSEESKRQLDEENQLPDEESQRRADIIYVSHAQLSIKPPISDPRKPGELTIKRKEGDVCSFKIESESILIQSLQTRTSDPEVPYQLMLFESDPRKLSGRVEEEDMIQMESVTQRIYTYPVGNVPPYVNRNGEKILYVAICVFARNFPIDFLTGELNDERKEYLEHAIHFALTLRYSVTLG